MKKFSQALVWLTISEIVFNIGGYIIQSSLGRILGPEDYGRYGLVVTLTTMVIILIGNGIPTAMSKYMSEIIESAPEKILGIKYQAIRLQIVLMLSITALFFFSAPLLSWTLNDPTLTPLFQLSSLIIPAFAAASFYFYYYTGLHFFRLQAILKMSRSLARIIFIIGFAYFFGVEGAISGYIAAPLTIFAIALMCDIIITHRYFPATKKVIGTKTELFSSKTLLTYAGPLTLFLLFYEGILTLDLYFVKSLLESDYLTGIYHASITVGRIPYFLFYALTIILLPAISKTTAERNTLETEALVTKALRLMTLLLFPLVTLLIAYAPEIIHLFYGPAFAESATPMALFALGVGFLTVFYVLSFALNGAGLVRIPMKLAFFGFLGVIALNYLLIPQWQLIGAALSTTLVSFVLMIAILFATKKHFQVHISLKTFTLSFLSTLAIALLAFLLPRGEILFLIPGALLFFLYFGILKLLGELTSEDLAPLTKLFKRS